MDESDSDLSGDADWRHLRIARPLIFMRAETFWIRSAKETKHFSWVKIEACGDWGPETLEFLDDKPHPHPVHCVMVCHLIPFPFCPMSVMRVRGSLLGFSQPQTMQRLLGGTEGVQVSSVPQLRLLENLRADAETWATNWCRMKTGALVCLSSVFQSNVLKLTPRARARTVCLQQRVGLCTQKCPLPKCVSGLVPKCVSELTSCAHYAYGYNGTFSSNQAQQYSVLDPSTMPSQ